MSARAAVVFVFLLAWAAPVAGQEEPDSAMARGDSTATPADSAESASTSSGLLSFFDPDVRGHANLSTELYHAGGIDPRRPTLLWRLNSGARTDLLGGMALDVNLVFSDEGVDFRQNVNQLGIEPSWEWGGLYLGDFTLDYQPYVVRGSRIRGGGLMYEPGSWRASLQAGRLERDESPGGDHRSYARTMVALKTGIGAALDSYLDLTVMHAWDALADDRLSRLDTLMLDTIPVDLRPDVEDRPQENWVAGLEGRIRLLDDRLTLEAEGSASLLTADREAPRAERQGTGADGTEDLAQTVAGELADVRLSSALDYAANASVRYQLPFGGVDGSYEWVGPGFGSLGVPYLLNDRRRWDVGANVRLLRSRIVVQGRYLAQANNLASQLRNTVDRNTIQLAVVARPVRSLTVNVSGVHNTMLNDAEDDFEKLDNTALALSTGAAWQHRLLGLRTSLAGEYGYQETESRDSWIGLSRVWTHRVSGSYRVRFSRSLTVAPRVSLVITRGSGLEERRNTRFGFNGTGRFIDGRLRTTTSVSHTTSRGRDALSARTKISYPIFWGTQVSLQVRHQRYSAFGRRGAFEETFFNFGIARTF